MNNRLFVELDHNDIKNITSGSFPGAIASGIPQEYLPKQKTSREP
ncbi:hypothetical protein [Picosynechococcus sp. PCC 7003]|nr:hypothetical protein [Picosynechococcus sp. PCC 7003]